MIRISLGVNLKKLNISQWVLEAIAHFIKRTG
jgi:hypothetical protein